MFSVAPDLFQRLTDAADGQVGAGDIVAHRRHVFGILFPVGARRLLFLLFLMASGNGIRLLGHGFGLDRRRCRRRQLKVRITVVPGPPGPPCPCGSGRHI